MSKASVRWLLTFLCCCTAVVGQINGRFYLEKKAFALGEPVFLYFEASNSGSEPQDIISADPYSFCAGYEIRLSSDPSPTSSCAPRQFGGSCLSGSMTLQPGEKYPEHILLNFAHEVVAPGDYVVEANRHLRHGPHGVLSPLASTLEVHERLNFSVGRNIRFDSKELRIWVDQLQSADIAKLSEAARTLASLAPPSLENTLLDFIKTKELRHWVPLAMHRLNTPRSMAVLAEILRNEPATPEHIDAARFLGSSGDSQWFPLLMALARKYPGGGYLYPAAENGGDRAVPILIELMHSDNSLMRQVAISAMAYTGSRAAVPVLLDLSRSSDVDTSQRALYGLRELTHQTLTGARGSTQSQYSKWLQWWSREGGSARIYKPTDCSEFVPLR